jgi:multiple sugar transport system ATP-binding protein
VRPEHLRFAGDSGLRGEVFSAEYMGTTQIVTVTTAHGSVKARLSSDIHVVPGEHIGLTMRSDKLSLFEATSGRAIRTALHDTEHLSTRHAGGAHG